VCERVSYECTHIHTYIHHTYIRTYRAEALSASAGKRAWKFKWYLLAFVLLILACDVVRSIFQGIYYPSNTLTNMAGAFFVFTMFVVASAFVYYAVRLLKRLRMGLKLMGMQRMVELKRIQVQRLTRRILISAIGMLITIGGTVLVVTDFFRKPYGFMGTWIIITVGLTITSLAQILAFVAPKTVKVVPQLRTRTIQLVSYNKTVD